MKAKSKLPISHLFVDLIPKELQPNILYICEEYKTASHLCFCGCNELTITPLTGGKFWDLIKEKDGTITLLGSIGNYHLPCKSHYVINKNIAIFL